MGLQNGTSWYKQASLKFKVTVILVLNNIREGTKNNLKLYIIIRRRHFVDGDYVARVSPNLSWLLSG